MELLTATLNKIISYHFLLIYLFIYLLYYVLIYWKRKTMNDHHEIISLNGTHPL